MKIKSPAQHKLDGAFESIFLTSVLQVVVEARSAVAPSLAPCWTVRAQGHAPPEQQLQFRSRRQPG
jgi:hypothetical protein